MNKRLATLSSGGLPETKEDCFRLGFEARHALLLGELSITNMATYSTIIARGLGDAELYPTILGYLTELSNLVNNPVQPRKLLSNKGVKVGGVRGEIANSLLNGTLCHECGNLVENPNGLGLPQRCKECEESHQYIKHKKANW